MAHRPAGELVDPGLEEVGREAPLGGFEEERSPVDLEEGQAAAGAEQPDALAEDLFRVVVLLEQAIAPADVERGVREAGAPGAGQEEVQRGPPPFADDLARRIAAGDRSMPTTVPVDPTRRAMSIASCPGPLPRSSTRSPGRSSRNRIDFRL